METLPILEALVKILGMLLAALRMIGDQVTKSIAKITEFGVQIMKTREELNAKIDEAVTKIVSLEGQVATQTDTISDLTAQVAALTDQIANFESPDFSPEVAKLDAALHPIEEPAAEEPFEELV